MQSHIQELIDELNNQGFDWCGNQLIVTRTQAIVINNRDDDTIKRYTIVKNGDNPFTCYLDVNDTQVDKITRDTVEQIVDYIVD